VEADEAAQGWGQSCHARLVGAGICDNIWPGAERMVELKGQEDVWNQLKEPGASDARSQLGGMSVKYAMGQIKRED
jgi:hypothetical protein